MTTQDDAKRIAAERAAAEVEDGMIVGLGSGTTASLAVEALGGRVAKGLRIAGIPTSEATAAQARKLGIALTDFAHHRHIDLTIDGADQVARGTLDLVKGRGGALLREKIVAAASRRMTVIVDETKLVDRLGGSTPLPVEIVTFGSETTIERLMALGVAPTLRRSGAKPFVSDGGNYIADCAIADISDPAALDRQLAAVLGVVATGLFSRLATSVIVGRLSGGDVMRLTR